MSWRQVYSCIKRSAALDSLISTEIDGCNRREMFVLKVISLALVATSALTSAAPTDVSDILDISNARADTDDEFKYEPADWSEYVQHMEDLVPILRESEDLKDQVSAQILEKLIVFGRKNINMFNILMDDQAAWIDLIFTPAGDVDLAKLDEVLDGMDLEFPITEVELKRLLMAIGATTTDDRIRQMIAKADLDNDGLLSFEEFKILLL